MALSNQPDPAAVAEILNRLRDSVRYHRSSSALSEGQDTRWRQIDLLLSKARRTCTVNPHLPIAWPEWPPGLTPKLVAAIQKVTRRLLRWYINPIAEQQNAFNLAVVHVLNELADLAKDSSRHAPRIEPARETADEAPPSLEPEAQPRPPFGAYAPNAAQSRVAPADGGGTEQPLLEQEHPGSTALFDDRRPSYLDDFAGCSAVLDIGCGRGEFVSLLLENNIGARGIDLDPDAVDYCRDRGLPVEQADAVAYLKSLDDNALDGISMAHVVEYLPPSALASVLHLAMTKLQAEGVLVIETINPACLHTLANRYLVDPSHIQPLHPELLGFLAESAGFQHTEIRYLAPVPKDARLEHLIVPSDATAVERKRIETMNRNIDRLNKFLFGYQDYALVTRRPSDSVKGTDE